MVGELSGVFVYRLEAHDAQSPRHLRIRSATGGVTRTISRFLLKFSGGHNVFRLLPDRTLRV